jgi:hypothetical protein
MKFDNSFDAARSDRTAQATRIPLKASERCIVGFAMQAKRVK